MALMLLDWLITSVKRKWPSKCLTIEDISKSKVNIARKGVSSEGAETALWQHSGLYT